MQCPQIQDARYHRERELAEQHRENDDGVLSKNPIDAVRRADSTLDARRVATFVTAESLCSARPVCRLFPTCCSSSSWPSRAGSTSSRVTSLTLSRKSIASSESSAVLAVSGSPTPSAGAGPQAESGGVGLGARFTFTIPARLSPVSRRADAARRRPGRHRASPRDSGFVMTAHRSTSTRAYFTAASTRVRRRVRVASTTPARAALPHPTVGSAHPPLVPRRATTPAHGLPPTIESP